MRASMSMRRRASRSRREHSRRHPARPHDAGAAGDDRRGHRLRRAAPSAQAVQPPYYRRQILRQMLEIGYYSLPVVGLTAIFTGMVLALQSYTGFARFSAESRHPQRGRAVADPRARAGAGRPDGGRPGRRRDGGRDRHHAGHRADRRADHAVDQSVQVPGGAAPDRRRRHAADPGAGRRHHRRVRRLSGRRLQARLQRRRPTCATPSTSCRSRTSSPAWSRPRCSAS